MPKTFAIGDIHGGLRALKQALELIDAKPEDRLIFLGDYVDGWSESAQTIDYLIQLQETYNCVFIKGNHDAWCEQWLREEEKNEAWLAHGGRSTIKSYELYDEAQRSRHLLFFQNTQLYYIDEENRLFIHAGFSAIKGPTKEPHISDYYWDRSLWEMALATDDRIPKDSKFYPKRFLLFKEIFIGHTPTLNYDTDKPMHACNVWNIDTGAAFFGKLSAMDVHTKTYWQSDTVRDLYPGENGRNPR